MICYGSERRLERALVPVESNCAPVPGTHRGRRGSAALPAALARPAGAVRASVNRAFDDLVDFFPQTTGRDYRHLFACDLGGVARRLVGVFVRLAQLAD